MKTNNQMYRGCSTVRCNPYGGQNQGYNNQGTVNPQAYPPVPTNVATVPGDNSSSVSVENFQEMMSKLIGSYLITELLIGVDRLVLRQGYLTAVGPSYYILYDPEPGASTVCDIYSLKFFTFFDSRERPTTDEFNRWLDSLRQDNYVFDSTEV